MSAADTSGDLTFASVGPSGITHHARCWSCMFGQHFPEPTWHSWADSEDIAHAKSTGQEDPSTKRCACPCVDDAAFCREQVQPPDEPDLDDDEPTVVSLNADPCVICGEAGACGYDAEGRAFIHVYDGREDER